MLCLNLLIVAVSNKNQAHSLKDMIDLSESLSINSKHSSYVAATKAYCKKKIETTMTNKKEEREDILFKLDLEIKRNQEKRVQEIHDLEMEIAKESHQMDMIERKYQLKIILDKANLNSDFLFHKAT